MTDGSATPAPSATSSSSGGASADPNVPSVKTPLDASKYLGDTCQLVPNSALLPKGAGHIVQVLDANGKARDVDVETGISDGAQTEIVSGVAEGTPIVALPGTAQRPASPFGN